MIVSPMIWLWACSGGDGEKPPPVERVLEGPAVGAHLAIEGGRLWVAAPGLQGDGGVYAFGGPSGSLSQAAVALASPAPLAIGPSFALCDLDGDSTEDIVIGAPDEGIRGGVWWMHGPLQSGEVAGTFVSGFEEDGREGSAVACGDIEGRAVVAVSAPDADGLGVAQLGGAVGMHVEEEGQVEKIANLGTAWSDSRLGFRTALIVGTDFDGDGVGDLAVGAGGASRVHVLFGPVGGSYEAATGGATLQGPDGEGAGTSLASGDLDGDGTPDLLIGAPSTINGTGAIWISSGPLSREGGLLVELARQRLGVSPGDQAGFSVAVAPDLDGDGTDEIVVGAPFAGGVGPEAGVAYLLLGPGTVAGDLDAADALFLGDVAQGKLGWSVSAGDIGSDGQIELAIGAPEADVGDSIGVGVVYTFPGTLRGVHYPDSALGRVDR